MIHVYELGSYFAKQGFSVLCATLSYTSEIKELYSSAGIELVTVYDVPEGEHFDIIYGLHYPLYGYLFSKSVSCEKLIMSSLSGFLTIESYPLYWKDASLLLVNTKENKQQQIERLNIPEDKIYVLENLIPEKFSKYEYKREKRDIPSSPLNIIVVSNHAPKEIIDLQKFDDISVTFFGLGHSNYQLITPEVLSKYDVVITIGKTVQYSLGMGIPVYEYDRFGGLGYITIENFEDARGFNFSGRSSCRKISSDEIHNELIQGYDDSYNKSSQLKALALECFDEPTNLNRLLNVIDCSPSFSVASSQSDSNFHMYLLNNKDFCDYVFDLRNAIHKKDIHMQRQIEANNELQTALFEEHESTKKLTQSFDEINNAFFWKITKPIRSVLDYIKKTLNNS